VLASIVYPKGTREWHNPVMEFLTRSYEWALGITIRHRWATVGLAVAGLVGALLLAKTIGSEFLPHLDEGAIWIRATMPYTISFDEASKLGPQVRALLLQFPQVTTVANELGRPDDGTDPIGFFNDEYFVGLKPYSDPAWHGAIRTKPQLTAAINDKLDAFPGIIFNFTQPAEDAVDEAETGLKSSLAVKIFGSDLETLEAKAEAVHKVIANVPGITDITLVRELGQLVQRYKRVQ
jgi:cobalt-zinc-cadmium resistance protein CzcA